MVTSPLGSLCPLWLQVVLTPSVRSQLTLFTKVAVVGVGILNPEGDGCLWAGLGGFQSLSKRCCCVSRF